MNTLHRGSRIEPLAIFVRRSGHGAIGSERERGFDRLARDIGGKTLNMNVHLAAVEEISRLYIRRATDERHPVPPATKERSVATRSIRLADEGIHVERQAKLFGGHLPLAICVRERQRRPVVLGGSLEEHSARFGGRVI